MKGPMRGHELLSLLDLRQLDHEAWSRRHCRWWPRNGDQTLSPSPKSILMSFGIPAGYDSHPIHTDAKAASFTGPSCVPVCTPRSTNHLSSGCYWSADTLQRGYLMLQSHAHGQRLDGIKFNQVVPVHSGTGWVLVVAFPASSIATIQSITG